MVSPSIPPLRIIGIVRTARRELGDTPVQSAINMGETGTIEIDKQYEDALEGLEGFDYLWLVTWLGLDRPLQPKLQQVPFLLQKEQRAMGVLATCGPRRINPIGLSLVRLLAVDGHRVTFAGVDVIDGTPLIDLKPYVAQFDRPDGAVRSGWFDELHVDHPVTPAELAKDGARKRS